MPQTRRIIALTFEDFTDHFPLDFAKSLVRNLPRRDGIDPGGPLVTRFREWVASQSDQSPDVLYVLTRTDAVLILEHAAGWWG